MSESRSHLSGKHFNADGETSATVVFRDGARREVKLTEGEATRLRGEGADVTSRWAQVRSSPTTRSVTKFVVTAIVGAVIGALTAGWIGDRFADQQLEVTIETDLVRETSKAALAVYEQAQNASRITGDPPKRFAAREAAADAWVEVTQGTLSPVFEIYYGKDAVVTKNWYQYQEAVYLWAVLACCTNGESSRQSDLNTIRTYVVSHTRQELAPSEEDWTSLAASDVPPSAPYQKVGLALLGGRGSLMNDLRQATPNLD